ncbi:hypothetical protein DFH11DRAFT_786091 [Phellopilus nigrolimitatus]|nr:hypothetical protein DFH11DRAFT_786091 [Phellopilus nigrolimitatus]
MLNVHISPIFSALPNEIVLAIVEYIAFSPPPRSQLSWLSQRKRNLSDDIPTAPRNCLLPHPLASLSKVSKRLRALCFPYLFSTVNFGTNKKLTDFERALTSTRKENELAPNVIRCLNARVSSTLLDVSSHKLHKQNPMTSIISILRFCGSLTTLSLTNIALYPTFLTALTQLRSLRSLILLLSYPFPHGYRGSGNTWIKSNKRYDDMPPLECLRLEPPVQSHVPLIHAVHASLRVFGMRSDYSSRSMSLERGQGLADLTFPNLECLSLYGVYFLPRTLRLFLGRHRRTIREVNVECSRADQMLHLSWVVRVIRYLAGEDVGNCGNIEEDDDFELDVEEGDEDGLWGDLDVCEFGVVFSDWSSSFCGEERSVIEFGLLYASNEIGRTAINAPQEDILMLENMFNALCFRELESLSLASDCFFRLFFSEFLDGLATICSRQLPNLRQLRT